MTQGGENIRIVPVIIGSKRGGLFQTILGAALIALLCSQPGGLSVSQDADNKQSYAFGGPVNSTAQGNPVAVLYGSREIGGAIISAGIYAEDQQ